jgi:hypothetical protein
MLIPGFQRQLDTDTNGTISKDEFVAGFDRWFTAWDSKKQGYLDGDAIRAGMNKDLAPTFGPPPGGGPAAAPRGSRPFRYAPGARSSSRGSSRSGWTCPRVALQVLVCRGATESGTD